MLLESAKLVKELIHVLSPWWPNTRNYIVTWDMVLMFSRPLSLFACKVIVLWKFGVDGQITVKG
jgi:hypothetical protein